MICEVNHNNLAQAKMPDVKYENFKETSKSTRHLPPIPPLYTTKGLKTDYVPEL